MPQIQTVESTESYAKFILEPLERGYGQTIGNSLRRVLLSSIQGAAVMAVRIDRVFHEFAPIPGAKEDTTELLLNLKNLSIKVSEDHQDSEEVVLRLDTKGPGVVTGADVICPEGVEIVNPEVYLLEVTEKEPLVAELYVGWDAGYTLPDQHERYKGMIGMIATGSQFTPVHKASYIVEQTRVGTRTDFERLVLEVWTNGSVEPQDALTQAAEILDRYFRMFFDLSEVGLEIPAVEPTEEPTGLPAGVEDRKIEELEFSQRTFNCLRRAGLMTLRELARVTESDLTAIRGFGKKSLGEVRDKLNEFDIELRAAKGAFPSVELVDEEADY